jgi:DeoR/GlpR family transcriptional regulator of sugar metabolism
VLSFFILFRIDHRLLLKDIDYLRLTDKWFRFTRNCSNRFDGSKTVAKAFTPPIFAVERQEKIASVVASRGKIHLAELTSMFDVSEATLRKDLSVLEQQGLLKRTHGGAVTCRAPAERDVVSRFIENVEAKQAIGRRCCDLIETGDAIFLDCGSTIYQLAEQLTTRGIRLTVLTNSVSVAQCLAEVGGVTHILLGGQLRRMSGCVAGPLALENLKNFSIGTAFIGASGITQAAITVADFNEAKLKAAVINSAQKVIVPIDQSKIGVSDFAKVCGPEAVDIVVTNRSNDYLKDICRDHEIRLEEAPA